MTILVTGGAGYIGSIMTRQLYEAGYSVIVIDNLSNSTTSPIHQKVSFKQADLADDSAVEETLNVNRVDAVIHFGGVISVQESMQDPGKYFKTNTCNTIKLLDLMVKAGISTIIFSSTAGVYGNPETIPIPETHPTYPTHAYGESKRLIETILAWYDRIYKLKSISLRYFNAAGASKDSTMGELHKDETHIIPLALRSADIGTPFYLYGTDYKTKDGTCVRDYIHVEDLCNAHIKALEYVTEKKTSDIFNVGTGIGYSNRELLNTIEHITGKTVMVEEKPRRYGDPDTLIADSTKIQDMLGWKPRVSDIETIIKTAWDFHRSCGYGI